MGRRVAQHVADMDLFFPMLDRLAKLSDGDPPVEGLTFTEKEIKTFADEGDTMRLVMHGAAHGDKLASYALPSLGELDRWRGKAFAMTAKLAQVDRDWYTDYWGGVFRSGFKAPRALRQELRRRGVTGA